MVHHPQARDLHVGISQWLVALLVHIDVNKENLKLKRIRFSEIADRRSGENQFQESEKRLFSYFLKAFMKMKNH